jgi:hypothetical protein
MLTLRTEKGETGGASGRPRARQVLEGKPFRARSCLHWHRVLGRFERISLDESPQLKYIMLAFEPKPQVNTKFKKGE